MLRLCLGNCIALTLFMTTGCSSIDNRLVGAYLDEEDSSGSFHIWPKGNCNVSESWSRMGPARKNSGATPGAGWGDCTTDGSILMMKMTQKSPDDFGYSEFRGESAILTIDGNTLISQSGRRFTKKSGSEVISQSTQPTVQPSVPGPTSLTAESAQGTIDRFVELHGSGRIFTRGGVREIPAQNAAVVEINVDDFVDNEKQRVFRGKPARATFSRYTDGRWALTEIYIQLPEAYGFVKWSPTIYVR